MINGKINMFVVNTTYHILIACSMYKEGDILINVGNKKYGELIQEMLSKTFECNVFFTLSLENYKSNIFELINFRKNMKKLKTKIDEKNILDIIVFNDVNPEVQWIINNIRKTGKIILVEEGIGLYRDIKKRHEKVFEFMGKILFGHKFENVRRIGESSKIDRIICRSPNLLSQKQIRKELTSFSIINFDHLKSKLVNLRDIKESIWFIGQPLVEDGVLSEERYLKIINKIKNIYLDLIIKPHPREDINKYKSIYGIKLIEDNDVPVELMINSRNHYKFFTIYSSAIISVSNYGQAFALYKIAQVKLPKEIEKIFTEESVLVLNDWGEIRLNEKI